MAETGGSLLESFFVRLGFKPDLSGLEKFEHHVKGIHHVLEALGVMAGIEYAKRIGEFIERNVTAAASVQELSEATDISTEKIAAMDRAALAEGVGMATMHEALMGINRAVGAASAGFPRYTALFQALGINAKKVEDPIEALQAVSEKLQGKSAGLQAAVAGRLGIDPVLMRKIIKGGEEFWESVREQEGNGLLKAGDYEQAHKTEIAFNKLKATISQITAIIGIKLAPIVERVTSAFQAWWKVNGPAVVQEFEDDIAYVMYYFHLAWIELGHIKDKAWEAYQKFSQWLDPLATVETVVAVLIGMKLGAWLAEVLMLVGSLSKALLTLALSNPTLTLLALGILGLISIGKQLKENWEPITQWFGEQWDGLIEKVKTLLEWTLRIPGVKQLWNTVTGGAVDKFLEARDQKHNDDKAKAEQEQYQSQRYAPTTMNEATGMGVWKLAHSSSTVKIDTVNIQADKGREATVGKQLKTQIEDAQGRVRDAQGPLKS